MRVKFVDTARSNKVSFFSFPLAAISLFGFVAWAFPLVTYTLGYVHSDSGSIPENVWLSNIVLHVFTGVLVDADTLLTGGTFWPLQTCIIGIASYITFTLPALLGNYFIQGDNTGFSITISALCLSSLANATMVAIIFELFQKNV